MRFGFVLAFLLVCQSGFSALRCDHVYGRQWIPAAGVQKNAFVTSRALLEYQSYLPKDFLTSLKRLGPDQHWLDLGAGKANAQIEFLKSFQKPELAPLATAVCYKLDRWFAPSDFNGKLIIKEGMFESQSVSQWKKADIITDVFGVLSYSKDLQTTFEKVFSILKKDGELFIYMNSYQTSFVTSKGRLSFEDLLRSVGGLRVEGKHGVLKVTKLSEEIQIPEMRLINYVEDAPPSRVFEVNF